MGLVKRMITIECKHKNGKPFQKKVPALVVPKTDGVFAVHHHYDDEGNPDKEDWRITHIPTGMAVGKYRPGRDYNIMLAQKAYEQTDEVMVKSSEIDIAIQAFSPEAKAILIHARSIANYNGESV